MKKKFLLMLPLCMLTIFAVCQNRVITGTVTDENGVAVEAASVTVQGTRTGTSTDQYGNYRLTNVAPNATLVVSGTAVNSKAVSVSMSGKVNVTIQKKSNSETGGVTLGALGLRTPARSHPSTSRVDPRTLTNGKNLHPNQSRIITGTVTDKNGKPLEGISVRVMNSRASTGTDSAGHYRILIFSDTAALVLEACAMWPHKEPVAGRTVVNIPLPVEEKELKMALQEYYETPVIKELD